jgi:hypothetical protein
MKNGVQQRQYKCKQEDDGDPDETFGGGGKFKFADGTDFAVGGDLHGAGRAFLFLHTGNFQLPISDFQLKV